MAKTRKRISSPRGPVRGKAEEVDAGEKEIYVRELYFTDSTSLSKDGAPVAFDALKEGGQVEVTVEKKGNKLEPISVKVMD